jgi:hypothetical protein
MVDRLRLSGRGSKEVCEQSWLPRIFQTDILQSMTERREKRTRWVQRGDYAVEVEVEVIYPADDPSEPCLEPATIRWLDEVARKAEAGDLDFLKKSGRVYQFVAN